MKLCSFHRCCVPSWLRTSLLIVGASWAWHPLAAWAQDKTTVALPTKPVMLRSVNSNKVLDIYNNQNHDGARIQQYDAWGGSMQLWTFAAQTDGSVAIVNPGTGRVLDVTGMSTDDGAIVQLWTSWGGANQHWRPTLLASGAYTFVNVNSGKCLDLLGLRTDDGAPVGQWDCNGKANQAWLLDGGTTATPTPAPTASQTPTPTPAGPMPSADVQVQVNATVGDEYPLIKSKFNVYNTAWMGTNTFVRGAPLLRELNVETMRLEQNWGFSQTISQTVSGTSSNLTYDWSLPDQWQGAVNSAGVQMLWGYDYRPYPFGGAHGDMPPLDAWGQICSATSQHLRGVGNVAYHEAWNEPDNVSGEFFTGSQADYFNLYATTVRNIRNANPDAKVGGPVTAQPTWYQDFANYVDDNNLPMDFFSFHNYMVGTFDFITWAAQALSAHSAFNTTEMLLDEYNTYSNWSQGGPQDTYVGASDLLDVFMKFLTRPELTGLYWAQFLDTDPLGLVTPNNNRKPTFYAWSIYGRIPTDRNAVQLTGNGSEAFAGSDAHRTGVVVLNRSGNSQSEAIRVANLGFTQGTVSVYRIDDSHYANTDYAGFNNTSALAPVETHVLSGATYTWQGSIPDRGTVYIEVNDTSNTVAFPPVNLGTIVRVNRYYPARGTSSWADFDRRTWVARLGMNDNQWADQEVGVTATGLPATLNFAGAIDGKLVDNDANSCACIRLDYATAQGYAQSVMFHGPWAGSADLYHSSRSAPAPFGTQKQPDRAVAVADMSNFNVHLQDYAPSGWNGRVSITYLLQNAGQHARMRVAARQAQ